MTAGSAAAKFAKAARDWRYELKCLSETVGNWLTTLGAICIGLFVIGMPILLLVVDHSSVWNVLSNP